MDRNTGPGLRLKPIGSSRVLRGSFVGSGDLHERVGLLGALLIGILAGWIAEMARDHRLLTNLAVGVIGSFVGAFLAHALGFTYAGFLPSLAVSAIGAVVLLLIVGLIRGRPGYP